MTQYLFEVQIGNFNEFPGDSLWSHNTNQQFSIYITADNLSQATREIERRFGNYTRCKFKYTGKELQ